METLSRFPGLDKYNRTSYNNNNNNNNNIFDDNDDDNCIHSIDNNTNNVYNTNPHNNYNNYNSNNNHSNYNNYNNSHDKRAWMQRGRKKDSSSEMDDDVFAPPSLRDTLREKRGGWREREEGWQEALWGRNGDLTTPVQDTYVSIVGRVPVDTSTVVRTVTRSEGRGGGKEERERQALKRKVSRDARELVERFSGFCVDAQPEDLQESLKNFIAARSPRKSFSSYDYVEVEPISRLNGYKERSTVEEKQARKQYKVVLPPPHVHTSSGLAVFLAWVDLSSFKVSLTSIRVSLHPDNNRRLVVEAVEKQLGGKEERRLRKTFTLPQFADLFELRHSTNVMGILKIEVPLLYYPIELEGIKRKLDSKTNAYIYTSKRGWSEGTNDKVDGRMDELNGEGGLGKRMSEGTNWWMNEKEKNGLGKFGTGEWVKSGMDERAGGGGREYRILVRLAEKQSIDNLKVRIEDNIIIITEVIKGDTIKREGYEDRRHTFDGEDDDGDEEDDVGENKRDNRIHGGEDGETRSGSISGWLKYTRRKGELKRPNKIRFVKLYKIPLGASRDNVTCHKLDPQTLKIIIPMAE